jgi:hypothetical protein
MHRTMQAHAHAHPDACDIATSRSKCSSRHTRVHHSARFVLTCTSYVVHNVALVVPRSDGFITVPEVPGLGVDIDIEECLKYPSTGNINQPDAGHGACCAAPCRAVLRCAARCCAPPCCAVLCCAVPCCAVLCCALPAPSSSRIFSLVNAVVRVRALMCVCVRSCACVLRACVRVCVDHHIIITASDFLYVYHRDGRARWLDPLAENVGRTNDASLDRPWLGTSARM